MSKEGYYVMKEVNSSGGYNNYKYIMYSTSEYLNIQSKYNHNWRDSHQKPEQ